MLRIEGERALIDQTMAERMVACGWIAAAFAGLLTAALSIASALGLGPFNLIDATALLAFAYGIFRRSRTCAVLALAYHLINRAFVYSHAGDVPPAILAGDLLLAALYVLGVIGTFSHHARRRRAAA